MGVKDYFNKLFEEPKTDDEDQVTIEEPIVKKQPVKEETIMENTETVARQESTKGTTYSKATRADVAGGSAVLELKVVRPESFSSVGAIADHLLNRCTVVLNLEATEADTARRIVDFLQGVAYSIDGQIKPVANNTFIITPKNVSITGEQLSEGRTSRSHSSDEF